jgi:hypothetical protein
MVSSSEWLSALRPVPMPSNRLFTGCPESLVIARGWESATSSCALEEDRNQPCEIGSDSGHSELRATDAVANVAADNLSATSARRLDGQIAGHIKPRWCASDRGWGSTRSSHCEETKAKMQI